MSKLITDQMEASLADLVSQGLVSPGEAGSRANRPDEIQRRLIQEGHASR